MFLMFIKIAHLYLQGIMCASTKQLQNQRRNLPCETNNTEFFAKYSASSLSV